MVYLNPDALRQLHADLSAFYDETVASAERGGLERAAPAAPASSGRHRPPPAAAP
jgi:hypothetical protein